MGYIMSITATSELQYTEMPRFHSIHIADAEQLHPANERGRLVGVACTEQSRLITAASSVLQQTYRRATFLPLTTYTHISCVSCNSGVRGATLLPSQTHSGAMQCATRRRQQQWSRACLSCLHSQTCRTSRRASCTHTCRVGRCG